MGLFLAEEPLFGTLAAGRTFPCDYRKAGDDADEANGFLQNAKLDPGRYYRNPFDIIGDRRLSNDDLRLCGCA